jgi:hypothetical protein
MLPAFVAVAIRSLVRLGLAHDAVNASACRAAARDQSNRRGKSLNCEQAKWRAALAATALTVALTLRTAQVRRPAGVGADSAHTGDNRASCAERWRQRQTPSGCGRAACPLRLRSAQMHPRRATASRRDLHGSACPDLTATA